MSLEEKVKVLEEKHGATAIIIGKYAESILKLREKVSMLDNLVGMLMGEVNSLKEDMCRVRHVPYKKLHPDAVAPKYYSDRAVAFDLHPLITNETKGGIISVEPHSQKIVRTGLAFSVPDGYELRISPRSGQSAKEQISIRNSPGIIDSDYRGEIMVIFVNNKDTTHIITKDQRICQVKLSKAYIAGFEEVDDLGTTERGEGRFGSTGGL